MSCASVPLVGALVLAASSCTWVAVSPEAAGVRLVGQRHTAGCERLGKVTTVVPARIGVFSRSASKVEGELAALARNEGARMGGDTVVPESPADGGRQVFGVYRCSPGEPPRGDL